MRRDGEHLSYYIPILNRDKCGRFQPSRDLIVVWTLIPGLKACMCLVSRMLAATSSARKRHVHSEAPLRINAKLRQERHGTRRQIINAGNMPLLTELEKRSKAACYGHG